MGLNKKNGKNLDLSRKNNYLFRNFLGETASELGIFEGKKTGQRDK